jgi:curved DNA-binding protein CbpA
MASRESGNSRLSEILLRVHQAGKSGVVRLERGKVRKQIVLMRGRVAFAESTAPEDHLARLMVELGMLEKNVLAKVSAVMKEGKTSVEAVAEAAQLSTEKIEMAGREQVVKILASLLSWSGCDPRLFACEVMPTNRLDLQMPVHEALLLAARRAAPGLAASCRPESPQQVVAAAGSQALVGSFALENAELFAYAQAQTSHPLEDFLRLLPGGSDSSLELVWRLLLLGLLAVEAAGGSSEEPAVPGGRKMALLEARIEDLLAQFEVSNYYEILTVPTDAKEEQIHAAYHALARQYHPDRFESREHSASLRRTAERLFTFITGAYTTLSDPTARAIYDEVRKVKDSQVEAARKGRAADVETEKMAETLFRAGCAALAAKDLDKAVSHLRECVWLLPEVGKYHHYLGVAQAGAQRCMKEAEQHLQRAIELDPVRIESRVELAKLYIQVRLPKRAEAQLLEVLRWDPDNPTARKLMREISDTSGVGKAAHRAKPSFLP